MWSCGRARASPPTSRPSRPLRAPRSREARCACRKAASLYAGDLLPDERYEEWAAGPREHLRCLLVEVLRQGRLWQRLLEHEPADEEAHRALMREHAERGDRAAALLQFERLRHALAPLGLEPSSSSESLRAQIAARGARPPIRYARSNGVHVAYEVDGPAGAPPLLLIPGWVSHLALDRDDPAWCAWAERLTSFARLVRFDKPGTGLSDRPAVLPAPAQRSEDARQVLDAAGVGRAHVLGSLDGGALAVLLAVRHPERVAGLILYGSLPTLRDHPTATWVETDASSWGRDPERSPWAPAAGPAFAARWAAYQRAAASPAGAAALVRANRALDVRSLLPRLRVATLVVRRRDDPVAPAAGSAALAAAIPGARLVELEGDAHPPWLGDAAVLCGEVERFVAGKVPGRSLA